MIAIASAVMMPSAVTLKKRSTLAKAILHTQTQKLNIMIALFMLNTNGRLIISVSDFNNIATDQIIEWMVPIMVIIMPQTTTVINHGYSANVLYSTSGRLVSPANNDCGNAKKSDTTKKSYNKLTRKIHITIARENVVSGLDTCV